MVVVDDIRHDEYDAGGHSYLETPNVDRLAAEGTSFHPTYHATLLCSPSRASLLTGQYASRHGILANTSCHRSSHNLDLFAIDLQKAGYRTAHVSKWHMGNDPTPRPGYDYWVSFAGQGLAYNPDLFEDGRIHKMHGYITDMATKFIRESSKQDKPFLCLYCSQSRIP